MSKNIVNNKFCLNIADEWQDNTVYSFEGPIEDGIKQSVLATIDHDVVTADPEAYADINIKSLMDELEGYRPLKREMIYLDNGLPACEVVYKWNPAKNREVYQKIFYVTHEKTGYILTATFSKKTWKTRGEEIDKILKSFQPGKEMAKNA